MAAKAAIIAILPDKPERTGIEILTMKNETARPGGLNSKMIP